MARRCQICGKLSPTQSQRCDCGYDFVTGEVGGAIERANIDSQLAVTGIVGGGGMIAAGVLGAVLGGALAWWLALEGFAVLAWGLGCAGSVSLVIAVVGLVKMVKATAAQREAARRGRTAEDRKALPEARALD